MTIGQRLRALRFERGKTQDELAENSGVPQAHISAIERGEIQSPLGDTILKLADALQVTTDYLLREEAADAD